MARSSDSAGALKPPLEKTIEQAFVRKAKALGCKCRKLNGLGNRDWPDQLVLIPGGQVLLIEFKRPGEKLRPSQQFWHDSVRHLGFQPYVFDNWQEPISLIQELLK